MRGLLFPLNGCCTGIKSLTLRKVGDRNVEESDLLRGMTECSLLYEWSSSINSMLGTLEEFKFQQGPRHGRQFEMSSRVHVVRTMDRLFGSIVLSVLFAGHHGRYLKRMEVRGVKSWIGHGMRLRKVKIGDQYEGMPFAVSLEDQVKVVVGRNRRCGRQG